MRSYAGSLASTRRSRSSRPAIQARGTTFPRAAARKGRMIASLANGQHGPIAPQLVEVDRRLEPAMSFPQACQVATPATASVSSLVLATHSIATRALVLIVYGASGQIGMPVRSVVIRGLVSGELNAWPIIVEGSASQAMERSLAIALQIVNMSRRHIAFGQRGLILAVVVPRVAQPQRCRGVSSCCWCKSQLRARNRFLLAVKTWYALASRLGGRSV